MLPAPGSPTYIPALLAHLHAEIAAGGEEWAIDPTLFSTLLLSQIVGSERGGVIVDVLPTEQGSKADGLAKAVGCVKGISQGIFGQTTHHIHLSRHTHPSDLPYALFLDPPSSWPAPSSRQPSHPPSAQARRSTISTPSSKYTSALPSPIFPRSYRAQSSRGTTPGVTPGITPKNSLPLFGGTLTPKAEYGFGPPIIPHRNGSGPGQMELLASEEGEPGRGPSLPQCLVISGLEQAESPVWGKLVDTLLKGYVEVEVSEHQTPARSDRGVESAGLRGEGPKMERWHLPQGFWVIWVRAEDKSETCPSWLIDQFSCSTCVYSDDLESPPPLPLRSIVPPAHIKALNSLLPYTHIHPPLQSHLSNLLSALSAHPRLKSAITSNAALLFPDFARAHRLVSAPFSLPEGWEQSAEQRREVHASAQCLSGGHVGLRAKKQDEGLVDAWGILAGEEPTLASLGDGDGVEGAGWDLDVQLGNVHAVFMLALRHRVAAREVRDEVMWLVKGSGAGDGSEKIGSGGKSPGRKQKRRERRRRREVDMIMEEIMGVV